MRKLADIEALHDGLGTFARASALVLATLVPSIASAQDLTPESSRPTVRIFAGGGFLATTDAGGAAIASGVRVGFARNLALSFDLGYGVVASSHDVQDRWWLFPSIAFVVPADRARLDIGAGLGLGAASGYTSWNAYVAAPFTPVWAYQLVPAFRAHAVVTWPVSRNTEVFGRIDVASLWLDTGSFGFRAGNLHPTSADTTWVLVSVGLQYRLI